jgi:acetate kinase
MENILVANAGSSSVKFQAFAVDGGKLTREIKGQMDGIGTRPRLRASGPDEKSLVDREYETAAIPDVPAALHTAGAWLRDEQHIDLGAVGHRVVHGGPQYDRPVLINAEVLAGRRAYDFEI